MRKTVLTIAGSDSSGGAGIQADLKTMLMNSVYGMSVITALTAQNTTGIFAVSEVEPIFVEKQLDAIFTDIYPDAIKIGMVASEKLIISIAKKLEQYAAKNIIIDPVMTSTSGTKLISDKAIKTLCEKLFPLALLITPNIPEAEILSGIKIDNRREMLEAAKIIKKRYSCSVLCKGGHNLTDANDLLYDKNGNIKWFEGKRINNPNTHGTGCTLSSAIASNVAKGYSLEKSIELAKKYLNFALSSMLNLGKGTGPLDHGFLIK
ncbi:bifunctional hydroxymethylpyrimidine kinase/phosphomethylpyrimidine kinase [Fusobacterium russii]|uniref:bifunctional hydroxymethylpyrimidine kinase/phosphomethylpyrimidine kinase n=1 Tax=Fusobacterium russii TaxID=854 RepID=UPI0003A4A0B2|nr:bifunctional hydroxymethylpyrimidine kinase/phosphomethylpyrimidine kinase [Fusobacterium russii]